MRVNQHINEPYPALTQDTFLVHLYKVEGDYWSTLGVHVRVHVHSQIFEIKIPTFILPPVLGMQMHEVMTFHHTKNWGHMTYISWLNDFN